MSSALRTGVANSIEAEEDTTWTRLTSDMEKSACEQVTGGILVVGLVAQPVVQASTVFCIIVVLAKGWAEYRR